MNLIKDHTFWSSLFGLEWSSRSLMLPLESSGWELRLFDKANSILSSAFFISSTRLFGADVQFGGCWYGLRGYFEGELSVATEDTDPWRLLLVDSSRCSCSWALSNMRSASIISWEYFKSASLSASIRAISDADMFFSELVLSWNFNFLHQFNIKFA